MGLTWFGRLALAATLALLPVVTSAAPAATQYRATLTDAADVWLDPPKGAETVPVPPEINPLIDAELKKAYANFDVTDRPVKPDEYAWTKKDFQVEVFKLATLPINADLYCFRVDGPFGWSKGFLVFRSKEGLVTKSPPSVWLKWLDGFREEGSKLLSSPYIALDNIDGDGQLVVETYAHNGTEYNASEYFYFNIGKELSLTPLFVLERRTLVPVDIAGFKKPFLERTLQKESPGHLKVIVTLKDFADETKSEPVGSYEMAKDAKDRRYHFVSQKLTTKLLPAEVLVTGAEESPDDFIAKGDMLFY